MSIGHAAPTAPIVSTTDRRAGVRERLVGRSEECGHEEPAESISEDCSQRQKGPYCQIDAQCE